MGNLSSSVQEMSDVEEMEGDEEELDDDEFIDMNYALVLRRIIESGQIQLENDDHPNNIEGLFRASLPTIKKRHSLDKLKKSSIYQSIKQASGYKADNTAVDAKWSVLQMLAKRERGVSNDNPGFSMPERCKIGNNYLPNHSGAIAMLNDKIFCGSFSKNGQYFVTASQDNILRVFDSSTSTYSRINRLPAKDVSWCILDIDFSPCGQYFVYCTWSSCLHISHVSGGFDDLKCLPMQTHLNGARFCIFSVAFSSCGNKIIGGSSDGYIYMFDCELNRRTKKMSIALKDNGSHNDNIDVNSVGFLDETSNTMYGGLDDGVIKIYDLRCMNESNPEPVGLLVGHYDGVTYIDPKNDGRYLLSNSKDQSIKLWDLRVFSKKGAEKNAMQARYSNIVEWDYRWDEVPQQFYAGTSTMEDDVSIMTYRGHRVTKSLIRAKFSPVETTGQRYIYTGCGTGRLVIYDVLTGRLVKSIDAHSDIVRDVAWHPYRPEILTSSWDTTVCLSSYKENITKEKEKRTRIRVEDPFSAPPRRSRRIALRRANMTS